MKTAAPEGPDAAEAAPVRPARAARRPRPATLDAVCAAAVDLARSAAESVDGADLVGEHLGTEVLAERLVGHSFACRARGYSGWYWSVSLARAPRARVATVCEVALLPGEGAIMPPPWVPWSQRLSPGDVGPHDRLPYRADDPYLEFGYEAVPVADPAVQGDAAAPETAVAVDEDRALAWELGLGRRRVLSPEGRRAAAARWYSGPHGPRAESALAAAARCDSCGFFTPLAGELRLAFGVCANEWSPDDGRVVSLDHGCGAHSETDVEAAAAEPLPALILDETGAEAVVVPAARD